MPVFTPPSPGAWELEQTHLTRPPSVFITATLPEPMMRGFSEGTGAYGILLDYLEVAVVNRFVYTTPRPVGAPKGARGTPPRLLFALLRRLHPEIRRRVKRAEEVFRDRLWREDVKRWDNEFKPALIAEARALLADDLVDCSDGQLADHVRRATDFFLNATYTHHRLNFCAMVPVGDFLVHAMEWTGLSAGELLQTMRGLSPVSAGAVEELSALRAAILANAAALALVTSNRPSHEILAELQAPDDAVGSAARAYIDVVGLRVLGGYDVADWHAREHPDLLVKIIRTAVTSDDTSRRAAAEQGLASIRERVPPAHRARFDELLAEAQHTYRIRDERVFHGDAAAAGIARRAILAAGDRLVARGAAEQADHLVDATPGEIISLLQGKGGPSRAELAGRARWRRETPMSAAPSHLGFPPSPPPPAEWLPPAAARMHRITGLVMSLMFDVQKATSSSSKRLKGFAVSAGTYDGPVRVIGSVAELPLVQRGEVLVTTSTGPTFNVVLPLIGALVTERGGVLSHAAIVSREYGLPGVVGCTGATKEFKTGTRVRVDGNTGEVWAI
jgi:pyruvate,water dikinase